MVVKLSHIYPRLTLFYTETDLKYACTIWVMKFIDLGKTFVVCILNMYYYNELIIMSCLGQIIFNVVWN